MKAKWKLCGILMLLLALVAGAQALPVSVDEVEIDGTELSPSSATRLEIERGDEVEVRIEMSANEEVDNVEVTGFISGYEYNDFESLSDSTHVFDMEENVTYVKKLYLKVPERVEEDDYKLRLIVSDRYGDEILQNYNLKIDPSRHLLKIRDVVFSPQHEVVAGRSLLTSVMVKNYGDKDEDSVKVHVSVPELGVSATDYIDEVEADDSVLSEEIWMRIPVTAEAGDYTVMVEVEYDEGYEVVTAQRTISVAAAEEVDSEEPAEEEKTVITISTDLQELVKGKGGSVYPITLTNEGTSSKTYVLGVEGVEDWATYRVSPSNVVVLDAGETQTVYVYLTAKQGADEGQKMFSVSVKSADEVLKEVPLRAQVVESDSAVLSWDRVKRALEIGFFVLVVVLVVLAIIVGFSLLRRKEEPDEISGQTYY